MGKTQIYLKLGFRIKKKKFIEDLFSQCNDLCVKRKYLYNSKINNYTKLKLKILSLSEQKWL